MPTLPPPAPSLGCPRRGRETRARRQAMAKANPYREGLDKCAANHAMLSPLSFLQRSAEVCPDRIAIIHGEVRHTWGETYARCRRLASALRQLGIGEGGHGRDAAAEHAGDGRGAFRRADGRRRAQHDQHPSRRRGDRLHPRPWRRRGAARRSRVSRCRGARARDDGGRQAPRDRRRGCRLSRGRAARRRGLRGVPRQGRSRLRVAAAGRRVGRDRARLHVGHHRQPQRCGHPPSRCLPQRGEQRARLGRAIVCCLPLDAADVPLQRLVLSVDDGRRVRHQCLPAPGRGEGDLDAIRDHGVTHYCGAPIVHATIAEAPDAMRAVSIER